MKILQMTNEFPPNIYGGAGVHVEYLTKNLAQFGDVEVRCFEKPNLDDFPDNVSGKTADGFDKKNFNCDDRLFSIFNSLHKSLFFNSNEIQADIIHCHTWYTHFAGILAKKLYGLPLVITSHSLEPLREWKKEQIGNGYDFSLWVEKTAIEMADAVIGVSESMKQDVINLFDIDENKVHKIYNGIDIDEFKYVRDEKVLKKYDIDPDKSYVLFLARITHQKGISLLLEAVRMLDNDLQVVLCAGAADTTELENEVATSINNLRKKRLNEFDTKSDNKNAGIIWIKEMVSKYEKKVLFSCANSFTCPSIYEPFGITNIEALACGTPVVASDVGGIVEIVEEGKNGFLIHADISDAKDFQLKNIKDYTKNLAQRINQIKNSNELRKQLSINGRKTVEDKFNWSHIAEKVYKLYSNLQT